MESPKSREIGGEDGRRHGSDQREHESWDDHRFRGPPEVVGRIHDPIDLAARTGATEPYLVFEEALAPRLPEPKDLPDVVREPSPITSYARRGAECRRQGGRNAGRPADVPRERVRWLYEPTV